MRTISLIYCLGTITLTYGAMAQGTFNYGFQTVFASQADAYLVSAVNVQKYSEWQSPPTTYWGPSANDVQGVLTYEFPLGAPSSSIALFAQLASFNFVWGNAHGYYGSGTGSSSLYGSTDGATWQLLLNDPMPQNDVASYLSYNQNVPTSLLGSSSFWLQVRLYVDGDPIPSYSDAQFSRWDTSQPNNAFSISATTIPEPSSSLLTLGGLVLLVLRRIAPRQMR